MTRNQVFCILEFGTALRGSEWNSFFCGGVHHGVCGIDTCQNIRVSLGSSGVGSLRLTDFKKKHDDVTINGNDSKNIRNLLRWQWRKQTMDYISDAWYLSMSELMLVKHAAKQQHLSYLWLIEFNLIYLIVSFFAEEEVSQSSKQKKNSQENESDKKHRFLKLFTFFNFKMNSSIFLNLIFAK